MLPFAVVPSETLKVRVLLAILAIFTPFAVITGLVPLWAAYSTGPTCTTRTI